MGNLANDKCSLVDCAGGVLLLYAHPYSVNAPTIMEHVRSFERYSAFKVWAVNTEFGFPKGLPRLHFSVIVFHYSLFGSYPFRLTDNFVQYLDNAGANYRIAFFQDEHQYCTNRFALIDRIGIDCIYTLLDPAYFDHVYSKHTNVKHVFHTLTGYVDDGLVEKARHLTQPIEDRSIDVGYRGRPLPYYMGKGAQEKIEIAQKFLSHASGLGMVLDIRTGERDRIYGDAWYEFLANCKAVIGVEAGVSVFDIDDQVRPAVEKLIAQNPSIGFSEVHEKVLAGWEDRIHYRTISPRVFEAAALRVCQVLYEGTYQDILKPMVHYIPLKKDFSNFNEVIVLMRDRNFIRELTERAYDDLIASGNYHYKSFINRFDEHLATVGLSPLTTPTDLMTVERQLKRGRLLRLLLLRTKQLRYKSWPGRSALKVVLDRSGLLRSVR